MSNSFKYRVALSFAGEDRKYVEEVGRLLQEAGVIVFYDDFEEVSLWGERLDQALKHTFSSEAMYVIPFISSHYAKKYWTDVERKAIVRSSDH